MQNLPNENNGLKQFVMFLLLDAKVKDNEKLMSLENHYFKIIGKYG